MHQPSRFFLHMQIHKQTDMHFPEIFLTQAESSSQQDRERLKTPKKGEKNKTGTKQRKQRKKHKKGKRGVMETENTIQALEGILNLSILKKQGKCDLKGETREIEREIF